MHLLHRFTPSHRRHLPLAAAGSLFPLYQTCVSVLSVQPPVGDDPHWRCTFVAIHPLHFQGCGQFLMRGPEARCGECVSRIHSVPLCHHLAAVRRFQIFGDRISHSPSFSSRFVLVSWLYQAYSLYYFFSAVIFCLNRRFVVASIVLCAHVFVVDFLVRWLCCFDAAHRKLVINIRLLLSSVRYLLSALTA